MKITPADMNKIEGKYDVKPGAGKGAAADGQKRLPRDRVCLSAACENMREADLAARAASEQLDQSAGADRLAGIKAMVDSGAYRVSGCAIAGAILGKA